MPHARVDVELVRRGLARSRRHAAELVAGARVMVAGRPVAKPSLQVAPDALLDVQVDPGDPQYASRAGGKLAGALDALAGDARGRDVTMRIKGAWCLDLGASTGGFTDVLLRQGAAHVLALDVGHDQLVPELRSDPRVTVREGFNARDLTPDDLPRPADVAVGDLSFISLTLLVPVVARVLAPGAPALLLVKPQFEVGRDRLGSGGVVRDPALRAEAILEVISAAGAAGLTARAVVPSPVPGPSGNHEYFCWLERSGDGPEQRAASDEELVASVESAVAWQPGSSPTPPVAHLPARTAHPIGGEP
jgi:23S rRNA (cytidine1920-2'-O)/16S rRNA (cytidine1409-2'-O)-methyltransferase